MPEWFDIFWDCDEQDGNVSHIAEHGVTIEEVEAVLRTYFDDRESSRAVPERWVVQGWTPSGRFLTVVFEWVADVAVVVPVTAFPDDED